MNVAHRIWVRSCRLLSSSRLSQVGHRKSEAEATLDELLSQEDGNHSGEEPHRASPGSLKFE